MGEERIDKLLDGHAVDLGALRRDLLHLLCMFAASPHIAIAAAKDGRWLRLGRSEPFNPADDLFNSMVRTETARMMLHAAVVVRTILDQTELSKAFKERKVGEVTDHRGTNILDLREACNKLIHADKFWLRREPYAADGIQWNALLSITEDKTICNAVGNKVSLSGAKEGKPWRATVEIYAFVSDAYLASIVHEDLSAAANIERKEVLQSVTNLARKGSLYENEK